MQEPDATRVRPELRVRVPQHVVYRDFPTQTVVLNLKTGRYHGLNGTAGAMFASLAGGSTVTSVAKAASERYRISRADAERDVCELCVVLLERGLVEPVDEPHA